MKKITNSKIQTALLRGAVLISGIMCTMGAMLFTTTYSGLFAVAFIGGTVTSLLCGHIEQNK